MKSKALCILLAALVVASCVSREEKARKTAEGFLSSYFRAEYREAMQFCTPSFASLLETAVEDCGNLPEPVRASIASSLEKTKFRIVPADNVFLENKAVFEIEISSEDLPTPLIKRLILIDEGEGFLVYALE